MPADKVPSLRRTLARAALVLPVLATAGVAGAGLASAAPTPSPTAPAPTAPPVLPAPPDSGCQPLVGIPGQVVCPDGVDPSKNASFSLNPLDSMAESCAKAASWVVRELAKGVNATTQVDFTNPGFIRQYAVVFGAATFLTLILWLIAVAKRAVNGVPLGRAVGEAVGFLWLAVLASAFTPVILAMMVTLTDAVTDAIATGTRTDTQQFLNGFAAALDPSSFEGGPIMAIFVSLLAMIGAAVIWVELLIRAAMLYVGAVLGCAVYSGLVDRDLWHHVRRWAGLMVAIDLSKPVIIIVLGLATAVSSAGNPSDTFSGVLTGLAIMFLSIFASVMIYRFVPGFGDEMAQLHASRRSGSGAGAGAASVVNSPASYMRQGIAAHAGRNATAQPSSAASGSAGGMASGMVTHAGRDGQPAVAPRQPRPSPPPLPPPPPQDPGPGRHARNGGSSS